MRWDAINYFYVLVPVIFNTILQFFPMKFTIAITFLEIVIHKARTFCAHGSNNEAQFL